MGKPYGQTNNSQKIYTHDVVFQKLRNRKLIFNYTLLSTVLPAKSDVTSCLFTKLSGFQGPSWPRILGRSDFSLQEN